MAKKSSAGSLITIVLATAVSAITAAYQWAQENTIIVVAVASGFFLIVALRISSRRKKRAAWIQYLHGKFKKEDIVNGILNSHFWRGQTDEQLQDSMGSPHAIDRQVLKTKRKEIWKYHEVRKGQFSLKIPLENGIVSSWDQKS